MIKPYKNDVSFYYISDVVDMKQISYEYEIGIVDNKTKQTKLLSEHNFDTNIYSIMYENIYSCFSKNCYRYTKCDIESNDCYIFLGCSFVFGLGVKDEETLPYYFSKLNNFKYKVINLAQGRRSTNTALNTLNTFINNSNVKHFFYTLLDDHIYRNFRVLDSDGASDNFIKKNGGLLELNLLLVY